MAEQCKDGFNSDSMPSPPGFAEYAKTQTFDPSAFQRLDTTGAELATAKPKHVSLNLENLTCFEPVEHQFEQWGVTFSNAIALQPSNPAYAPRTGTTVLMGSPRSGWLEARFRHPVCYVSGSVTSSRRTVLAAFDTNNQPLSQTETPSGNLAGADATVSPNLQLSLSAENIQRITFYAFDGQLTLDEFSFTYQ